MATCGATPDVAVARRRRARLIRATSYWIIPSYLVRGDHRLDHAHEAIAQSLAARALGSHARAFEQQEELVREQFRLGQAGRAAELGDALALCALEGLDHAARRVPLLRQLDGGIGKGAAAVIAAGETAG